MNLKKLFAVAALTACVLPVAAQYPVIPDSVKIRGGKQQEEIDRKSDEAWAKALPVVMSEATQGRPYKPWPHHAPSERLPHGLPSLCGRCGGGRRFHRQPPVETAVWPHQTVAVAAAACEVHRHFLGCHHARLQPQPVARVRVRRGAALRAQRLHHRLPRLEKGLQKHAGGHPAVHRFSEGGRLRFRAAVKKIRKKKRDDG